MDYGGIQVALQNGRRQYYCRITKGVKKIPVKLWGGLIAENLSQALARDIFAHILVQLHKKGYHLILHVHDEVVIECDEGRAGEVLKETLDVMSQPPSWIPNIPLQGEGKIVNKYEK